MRYLLLAFLLAGCASSTGESDSTSSSGTSGGGSTTGHQPKVCTPYEIRDCTCSTGYPGRQTCSDNGTLWLTCHCIVTQDAGAPVDAGCTMRSWYRDADLDGYGDPFNSTRSCTQPTGYVANSGDCADQDPNAHPDAGFQGYPINGPHPSVSEWDRDCDGALAYQFPSSEAGTCADTHSASTPCGQFDTLGTPPCGQSFTGSICRSVGGGSCQVFSESAQKVQGCK